MKKVVMIVIAGMVSSIWSDVPKRSNKYRTVQRNLSQMQMPTRLRQMPTPVPTMSGIPSNQVYCQSIKNNKKCKKNCKEKYNECLELCSADVES